MEQSDSSVSKANLLGLLSWISLLIPFIAVGMCIVARLWPHGMPATNIVRTRSYAFLASAIIGTLALVADIVCKRPRLLWRPVAGLICSGVLYMWTERMVWIF
jgi:hypothetical protein